MNSPRLAENFVSLARSFGEQVAVVDSDGTSITYNELASRIETVRDFLLANGLRENSRVALLKEKSIDAVVAILGILQCRATYIPIDPGIATSRIRFLIENCDPAAILLNPNSFPGDLPCQLDMCISVPGTNSIVFAALSSENPANELAYILYTSGSTGNPKGVCISNPAAVSFVNWCTNTFPLNRNDHVASIAPFHFDLSIFDLFAALSSGATLHLFTSDQLKNPRLVVQIFSEKNISVIYATPTFLSSLVEFGKLEKSDWPGTRLVLFAGEVFPVKPLHALMNKWKAARFFNLYGPTETNVCTYAEIRKEDARTSPYPIGKVCKGHAYEISPGGELLIGGPNVADGYLNLPELSQARFFLRDGQQWFRTGDVVTQDENGNLIYKGRIDRMIKRRGYRVEPAEIESALMKLPDVTGSAIVATENERSVFLNAIVTTTHGKQLDLTDVKAQLLAFLPDYMLPDTIRTVLEFPRSGSGKMDYAKLQEIVSSF